MAERKRKEKAGCRKTGQEKLIFFANFELNFPLPLSMKLAPIYRAGKRVILSSTGKSLSP